MTRGSRAPKGSEGEESAGAARERRSARRPPAASAHRWDTGALSGRFPDIAVHDGDAASGETGLEPRAARDAMRDAVRILIIDGVMGRPLGSGTPGARAQDEEGASRRRGHKGKIQSAVGSSRRGPYHERPSRPGSPSASSSSSLPSEEGRSRFRQRVRRGGAAEVGPSPALFKNIALSCPRGLRGIGTAGRGCLVYQPANPTRSPASCAAHDARVYFAPGVLWLAFSALRVTSYAAGRGPRLNVVRLEWRTLLSPTDR